MKIRKSELVVLLIVLSSLLASLYFSPKLPAQIASHWNYKGEVDGYLSKTWGIFLMPAFLLGLFFVFIFVPKLDPLKANVEKFRKYFDGFIILLFLFMLVIHFQTILWTLGVKIKPNMLFPIGLGILFYYIGIMFYHSQRNWFIGIKTPWTLSSDLVWEKTHKLGSKLLKMSGIVSVAGALFSNLAIFFTLAPAILSIIYLSVYSYIEYRKEQSKY